MSSLFADDELITTAQFLRKRFGKDTPERHEIPRWKVAEVRHFLTSHHYAVSNYFVTIDEITGELVKMRPFTGQAILSTCIQSQKARGLPRHIIEYKPRQCGWTSWNLGEAIHNALHPNASSLILVDDEDVAEKISTKVSTMVNGLPVWMQPKRRIQNLKHFMFENPNPKERIYDPGLNASIQITIPTSFRGHTPPFVVVSEFAFMDDKRKELVTQGLIPAMHMTERVTLIIDTTPNGYDDYYYPMVMEAIEDNPKWAKRLLNAKHLTAERVLAGEIGEPDRPDRPVPAISFWHHHEGYTTRDDNPRGELRRITKDALREIQSDLGTIGKYGGDEEVYLKEKWDLSYQRLYWRRRKIDSYKLPTPELRLITFRQEFVSDLESGFVNYEGSPFDRECLDVIARQVREPYEGILRLQDDKIVLDTTFKSDWQSLRVYAPPEPHEQYSMGIDTNIAYESLKSDATVAQVVRFRDNKIVATYEARVPEHILRQQLFLLYQWYFHPYYAPETKGIGYQLVRTLIDMGMHNVYYWKRLDADMPEPSKFPGWETTSKTRPLMDETLVELICRRNQETNRPEPDIVIPDRKTLRELQGLTRSPTGALKSSSGHDDHTDALAIALCIARDPYGGFHRKGEGPNIVQQRDFHRLFKQAVTPAAAMSRNRPDLANI